MRFSPLSSKEKRVLFRFLFFFLFLVEKNDMIKREQKCNRFWENKNCGTKLNVRNDHAKRKDEYKRETKLRWKNKYEVKEDRKKKANEVKIQFNDILCNTV